MSDQEPGSRRRWWPRLSIRLVMALVALFGLVLYLGMAAVDVLREKENHVHTGIMIVNGSPSMAVMGGYESPFWPLYYRRLLGRPWKGLPLCGRTPGVRGERCEFAHPEMVTMSGTSKSYMVGLDPGEWDRVIEEQKASPSPAKAAR